MDSNKIIILIGPSGTGKDSLASLLSIRLNYPLVVMNTTRPARPLEIDGINYHFKTKEKFLEDVNNDLMIDYKKYDTLIYGKKDEWYYGISKDHIKNDEFNIIVLTREYLHKMKSIYGDRIISIFVNTNNKVREDRAKKRSGFNKIEWDRRIKADEIDFKDIENDVDVIIHNNKNNLEIAYAKLILKLDFIIGLN